MFAAERAPAASPQALATLRASAASLSNVLILGDDFGHALAGNCRRGTPCPSDRTDPEGLYLLSTGR